MVFKSDAQRKGFFAKKKSGCCDVTKLPMVTELPEVQDRKIVAGLGIRKKIGLVEVGADAFIKYSTTSGKQKG